MVRRVRVQAPGPPESAALQTKCRPRTFDEVIGNEAAVRRLKRLATSDSWDPFTVLDGPYGTGKTSLMRIVVKRMPRLFPEQPSLKRRY